MSSKTVVGGNRFFPQTLLGHHHHETMLRELRIKNLALIENLEVRLDGGLTVLTGETGAGKSIILQAIHLLGGGRASADSIRSGAESCEVEACFAVDGNGEVTRDLLERGVEAEGAVRIRRLLSPTGSRFFVNERTATAKGVGELAEHLLCVASQHDHQQLLVPALQLDFVDLLGGLAGQRERFAAAFDRWRGLKRELDALRAAEAEKERRRDFLIFQTREIEEAAVRHGEDEELLRERDRLRAADDLLRLGGESLALYEETLADAMGRVRRNVEQMAAFDPALSPLLEEMAGAGYQFEETAARLRRYCDGVAGDPARLDEVGARLHLLQGLKKKYGPSLAEVLAHGEAARAELATLEDVEGRIEETARELSRLETELLEQARELSAAREAAARELSGRVTRELRSLALEQAVFTIAVERPEEQDARQLARNGWDEVTFLFSANPGEPSRPVARIASGGELSRLMLALKCILAALDRVETVIFDEVDTGVSGRAAESVAVKIRELASHHQVLCITHLPQIAARADAHFQVSKTVQDGRTQTCITPLDEAMRVEELARMLDGASVTERTRAYVRELLGRSRGQ